MQLQVNNSPFSQEQAELLNRLLPTITEAQQIWLSGYLAAPKQETVDPALQNTPGTEVSSQNDGQTATREVTVLFGSETGNGQMLAEGLSEKLVAQGLKVATSAMDDFKPKGLKKVEDLLIVTATHGEGDPPDNALSFNEFLNSRKAPKLDGLRFSVLSLGDQSYEFFCQTGKDLDKRLEELGGERLYPRVDCDLDFDEPAAEWMEGVLESLRETQKTGSADEETPLTELLEAGAGIKQSAYSRTNPFKAEILDNWKLNGRGSNKETRHLELSLEGSNLEFEPGDSLGVFPENNPELVEQIIDVMNWNPEEIVPASKKGDSKTLRDALHYHFEITILTKPLLKQAALLFENEALIELLEPERDDELKAYLDGRDVLDLIQDYPPQEVSASEFVQILRKIPARLYSISSSFKANPDEVHLTIGTVRYEAHGRDRTGVFSGQCAERTEPGEMLPIYIHRNPNFKFPADQQAPVIMIGPGTGVAPFRSFLEEREELGAEGKTWLFFGEQHFASDFLYQVEWQNWLKEGVLSKLDVAFSRDTAEKVYVQHRMLEKSREFYQWLEKGASVYVCGDEQSMANDVHNTLTTIIEQEGAMTKEEAEVYLTEMRHQKRYQRDVY
ncbi:assimilatory sulfite reductase (NADPH) flavoprotein subunit [Virgibacillus phasianinus]|uniref:assimilatory sulfite reductase (NADPH) n=1 Tax=Virgibacillus phasianinus TaxID=2017483 RepID=A0A220U2A0_9BACI|nr:assimilatory sulfite reductase (NADPH) flavoprotein subunit [Virgibacillus phasianinus]ASK62175.1 assimilatory sulfite reductase (NADPH) flavoprotein subunit [Virgibacillus phasianinus]